MPCLNCYQTFILGDNKQQVVYRGNAIKRASSTSDESDAETLDKNVDADKDLFVSPSPSINGSNKAYQQASKLLSNQKAQKSVDPAPLLTNSSSTEESDFPVLSNKERVAEAKRKNRPRSTAQNPPPRAQPSSQQAAPAPKPASPK